MTELKIVYCFKPVDVTYVIVTESIDGELKDIFCFNSEKDLPTTPEQIAFVQTKNSEATVSMLAA